MSDYTREVLKLKYPCPCCGYKTLDEKPPGTFQICEVCFWEDDNIQFENLDVIGGANDVSLRQAQENFNKFGACTEDAKNYVRKPTEQEKCDVEW